MELEMVYGNDGIDDEVLIMSEKVQSVATSIYREFERMIPTYGEEVIKDMMPHIVGLLENLNLLYKEIQEKDAELELCKDDNEQLMNQYDREKQIRKATDQRMMTLEDLLEEERKEKDLKIEALQIALRTSEMKSKSVSDHVTRLEEKDSEMKKDYGKLHDRYNELLKRHIECVEKTKMTEDFNMTTSLHRNFHLPNLKRYNPIGDDTPLMTRSLADYEAQFFIESPYSSQMPLGEEANTPTEDNQHQTIEKEIETKHRLIIPDEAITNMPIPHDEDDDDDDIGRLINPSEFSSDIGDNFFGMSKEIENLIMENTELMSMKNALNVLKDDLIVKVDSLNSELEIVKDELVSCKSVLERQKVRIAELEGEMKDSKEKLDSERRRIGGEDDNGLPMAQRKRFTRVEMARVLMERNQYKERLMELQEAVRWTELLRASREHPDLLPGGSSANKKRSSIWNYFERLFSRRLEPQRRSLALASVHYNAPTSPKKKKVPTATLR